MALRTPIAINQTYGYSEEVPATDTLNVLGPGAFGGNVAMNSNKVTGLAAATTSGDAASYGQSGLSLAGLALTAALAMGGFAINNVLDPVSAQDAATKNYVDSKVQGLTWMAPALTLATTNQALTGLPTIDGITMTNGQRVLLTAQTTASQNGVYAVASGAWSRAADMPAGAHAASIAIFVEEGTANADTAWTCTTDPPNDIVGTNSLTFTQFGSTSSISAGNGLSKAGTVISTKAGDGIETVSNSNSTNVRLDATAPGLLFTGAGGSGALKVLVDPNGGLSVAAAGVAVKVDTTTSGNPTLAEGANGLRVIGLPSLFAINSVATSANVTSANLGTLTAGATSDASALHKHVSVRRIADTYVALNAFANGDPAYWSATTDNVDKAAANADPKAFVIGVAEGAISASASGTIVSHGPAVGVLTGATPGTPYYLQATGGLGTSLPGSGNRIIQVGVAKNATDLWVHVRDYAKKA